MSAMVQDVLATMKFIEEGDPLDLGDLALDEVEARNLVALSMAKFSEDTERNGQGAAERELLALAVAGRVLLDNLRLHVQVLRLQGAVVPSAADLLKRFGRGG